MVKDQWNKPFTVMVALGESTVAGACATRESFRWPNILRDLISEYQGSEVTLHNKGIGANVISPRSPGYEASRKPSALERYEPDVIALEPDLFVFSYGLNDMRAGMRIKDFCGDMKQIISGVKKARTCITVLTTVYRMTAFDLYPPFDKGSVKLAKDYNKAIKQVALENDCLLADVWDAEGGADWLIHPDTVHPNDAGHRIIANRVFETIVKNCSGVVSRITRELQSDREEVQRTMAQRRKPVSYAKIVRQD